MAKCWTIFHGFAYNSLISRPFFTRKVSNRSSHHALHKGQGVVSLIQLSVWSTVRSNFGQTWSTLVKLSQIWSKLSELWEMHPESRFVGFFGIVNSNRLRNSLVKPRSTLVKLGQPLENLVEFREMCPKPHFEVIRRGEPLSDQAGLVRAVLFCVPRPEKIPGVKIGL